MSKDYERLSQASGQKRGKRGTIIMLAIAFVAGVILSGWAITRYNIHEKITPADEKAQIADDTHQTVAALDQRINEDGTVAPPTNEEDSEPLPDITADQERALATRVADLEDRISRINVQAQAASGNAARAEGILIAFAVRRTLESGNQLGYLQEQLELRFGNAQPNAVKTIITASENPITLDQLRGALVQIAPDLSNGEGANGNFWQQFKSGFNELFVLRKEGTPSPLPSRRVERAMVFMKSGKVDSALAEIEALPQSKERDAWTASAKLYIASRTALDLIETAAILEPKKLRTSEGENVSQPSPLSPNGTLADQAQAQ